MLLYIRMETPEGVIFTPTFWNPDPGAESTAPVRLRRQPLVAALDYPFFNATTGSIRVAWRAGTYAATMATPMRSPPTPSTMGT
jgi:hypothetical protein